jgi:hypothetical protein
MTDTQEYCCAAGVCCGGPEQLTALALLLETRGPLSPNDARNAAEVILRSFDILPKAAGLSGVVKYIQAHPYRG